MGHKTRKKQIATGPICDWIVGTSGLETCGKPATVESPPSGLRMETLYYCAGHAADVRTWPHPPRLIDLPAPPKEPPAP